MKAVFVTGTDTGVGKTIISVLLARFLLNRGYKVIIQKWIQTGDSTCLPAGRELPKDCRSVYTFKFPSSPHLAASLGKRKINANKIKESFRFLQRKFDFVIVEGIGGALVPINRKRLVIDIAKELNLGVLIVAANKLGAINHTLLTVEAIRKRNVEIIGIVFNNQRRKQNRIIMNDNPKIIKKITGERILGVLPYNKNKNRLYKAFLPIGKRILKQYE